MFVRHTYSMMGLKNPYIYIIFIYIYILFIYIYIYYIYIYIYIYILYLYIYIIFIYIYIISIKCHSRSLSYGCTQVDPCFLDVSSNLQLKSPVLAAGFPIPPSSGPGTPGSELARKKSLPTIMNYGKIHHFQWLNPLFQWEKIAMLVIARGKLGC